MSGKAASLVGGGASTSSMSALSRTGRPGALAGAAPAKKKAAKLDPEQLEELKEAFTLFDTDSNGLIDAKELKAAMRALGFQVKKAEVRKMIVDINKEEAGAISLEDFVEIMTGRMGDRDSREEIAKVFALFDCEGAGKINFRDLKVREGLGGRGGARAGVGAGPRGSQGRRPTLLSLSLSHTHTHNTGTDCCCTLSPPPPAPHSSLPARGH
jgi:Ca2+-binding EF-hand superfamily protein